MCVDQKQIIDSESNNDVSLSDLLDRADLTETEAPETSCTGIVVVLRRECCYNSSVLLALQANMDIQFVLSAYACVLYVASYIMKTEWAMGELLKQVAAEARNYKKSWFSIPNTLKWVPQEAVYRLLSLHMKRRSVVFVDTNPKHGRIAVLKNNDSLREFAATLTTNDCMCDALPNLKSDSTSTWITLTDVFSKITNARNKLWLDSQHIY